MSGAKHDSGKLQWHLLRKGMPEALEAVISVLEFGAKKYAANSWQEVPNGAQRYRDAMDRHLSEQDKGITHDDETGLPHAYHVACNALFLAWFEHQRIKAKEAMELFKADEAEVNRQLIQKIEADKSKTVPAKVNDWIEHTPSIFGDGVPQQVNGTHQRVDVVLRNKRIIRSHPAHMLTWTHRVTEPNGGDIIKWRHAK